MSDVVGKSVSEKSKSTGTCVSENSCGVQVPIHDTWDPLDHFTGSDRPDKETPRKRKDVFGKLR